MPGQPFIGLVGHARVIDGDTLEIISAEPTTVRLCGIDAPELGQTCVTAEGQTWPCGEAAADALRELIGGEIVLCAANSTNRYGRMLVVCSARGLSLNATMLGLGAWAGGFMQPWEWAPTPELAGRMADTARLHMRAVQSRQR